MRRAGAAGRIRISTLCWAPSCAIHTIAESAPPVRARATGTAALAEIASSRDSRQVMARWFTGLQYMTYRIAFLSHRAVSDLCLGENCPAAARR